MNTNDIITNAKSKQRKFEDDAQFRSIIHNFLFSINTKNAVSIENILIKI